MLVHLHSEQTTCEAKLLTFCPLVPKMLIGSGAHSLREVLEHCSWWPSADMQWSYCLLWQCTDPCGCILEFLLISLHSLRAQVNCRVIRVFSLDTIPRTGMWRFLLFSNKEVLLFVASWSNELLSFSCLWNSSTTSLFMQSSAKSQCCSPWRALYQRVHQMHPQNQTGMCHLPAVLFTSCEGSLDVAAEVLWFGERSGCT